MDSPGAAVLIIYSHDFECTLEMGCRSELELKPCELVFNAALY